ncbi:Os06g0502600 [Oryza sativa Japonica Group]|uniref:Os06g0502600 protein n=1 Tax=Oryza sativa subsp. japonica TaxID=39947 RepID=C7J3R9_ORYSJ|nr:Os06g0502600 [Oryza sativa Japonica Group]|eukprot:NP_001174807.1 Os06g0502600 [Oryza sativa Japonica Group]
MISAICWIPRGAVKTVPLVAAPPTREEIHAAIGAAAASERRRREEIDTDDDGMDDIDGAQEEDEVALQSDDCSVDYIADGLRELDMENYDDEDGVIKDLCSGSSDLYYPSNDMDPYLKNKNNGLVSILEEMEDGHPYLYPYDEIVLLGIPLCVPWSDCGLMDGQKDEKIQDWKPETLYLIGIDWNKENILASASADKTVKIWDVAAGKCVTTLEHHDAKVKLWDISSNQPSVIASLNPKVGAIFSISFSKDNPFLLAVGGQKGNLKLAATLEEKIKEMTLLSAETFYNEVVEWWG